MAALNEMISRRERGEDPEFEKFMEKFGDFFPENPKNLDELLESWRSEWPMPKRCSIR